VVSKNFLSYENKIELLKEMSIFRYGTENGQKKPERFLSYQKTRKLSSAIIGMMGRT
jgi:hypothetical protein